jgi:hypothetical protein
MNFLTSCLSGLHCFIIFGWSCVQISTRRQVILSEVSNSALSLKAHTGIGGPQITPFVLSAFLQIRLAIIITYYDNVVG